MLTRALLTVLALCVPSTLAPVQAPAASGQGDALHQLLSSFESEGIHLDLERGLCTMPADVLVRGDLLEYLIVTPRGATHESAFVTSILPSRLNAALLTLGIEPGHNARWVKRDPAPTPDEMRQGVPAFDIVPPEGDGAFMYVAWKLEGETYFFRMEDLLLDLATGQTMRRHKWVYLGSRMVGLQPDGKQQAFAADLEGNLVNISLFDMGNTLFTGALPECIEQTIWQANFWLLPAQGSPVELIFSRKPLETLPGDIAARLRQAERPKRDGR